MRKRMVAALLAATMVLGLTACGGSDSGSDSKSEGDGKTVNVYVGSDLEGTLDDEIEAYKKVNPDAEIVKVVKEGLRRTGGYCPCRTEKKEDYKCMCREFREQIEDPGFEGYCHCMLYYKAKEEV